MDTKHSTQRVYMHTFEFISDVLNGEILDTVVK